MRRFTGSNQPAGGIDEFCFHKAVTGQSIHSGGMSPAASLSQADCIYGWASTAGKWRAVLFQEMVKFSVGDTAADFERSGAVKMNPF